MKTSRKEEKNSLNFVAIAFLVVAIFFISFAISYLASTKYYTVKRVSAITLEEEANQFEKALDKRELDTLYEKSLPLEDYNPSKVLVLGYHQIREYKDSDGPKAKLFITLPETFEKEMKLLLDSGYKSINFEEYLNYLDNGNRNTLPEKAVLITFDDGYSSQYNSAFPILRKYNFTATFFIYSECISKYPGCMTWGEIKELSESGMKIANHTLNHSFLTEIKKSQIRKEILDNQKEILKHIDEKSFSKVLAYPFGGVDDNIKNILWDLGYKAGAGVKPGFDTNNLNTFNLHRFLLGNNFVFFKSLLGQK